MDIQQAELLASNLMTQHGLYDKGWRFEYDRAKKRIGGCDHSHQVIQLSATLTALNSEEEIRDTILHEIAHALVGYSHGHDTTWKLKAREIGARPERCYDTSKLVLPKAKYLGKCSQCGIEIKRYKFGRAMARGKQYHATCGKNSSIEWRQA